MAFQVLRTYASLERRREWLFLAWGAVVTALHHFPTHALRHSFATHLLEAGTDLRYTQ